MKKFHRKNILVADEVAAEKKNEPTTKQLNAPASTPLSTEKETNEGSTKASTIGSGITIASNAPPSTNDGLTKANSIGSGTTLGTIARSSTIKASTGTTPRQSTKEGSMKVNMIGTSGTRGTTVYSTGGTVITSVTESSTEKSIQDLEKELEDLEKEYNEYEQYEAYEETPINDRAEVEGPVTGQTLAVTRTNSIQPVSATPNSTDSTGKTLEVETGSKGVSLSTLQTEGRGTLLLSAIYIYILRSC